MRAVPYLSACLLLALGATKLLFPAVPEQSVSEWYTVVVTSVAVFECLLGVGLLWKPTRRIASATTLVLGVAFVLWTLASTYMSVDGGCGCLGRIRLDAATRLMVAGAVMAGGALSWLVSRESAITALRANIRETCHCSLFCVEGEKDPRDESSPEDHACEGAGVEGGRA